jgi:hypothetical protein
MIFRSKPQLAAEISEGVEAMIFVQMRIRFTETAD